MELTICLCIVFGVSVAKFGWLSAVGIMAGIYLLMPYRFSR
jgi:hypothetical protein